MNKSHHCDDMADSRNDSADDACASESGFLSGGRHSENERLMASHSVNRDGLRFEFHGYHYDKLTDALAYSEQVGALPGKDQDDAPAFTPNPTVELPSADDQVLMTSLGIRFDEGTYRFDGYRYAHLLDAVNYARLTQGSHVSSPGVCGLETPRKDSS